MKSEVAVMHSLKGSTQRYQVDSTITVDFSSLDDDYRDLHKDEEEVKKDEMAALVRELIAKVDKCIPPKMRNANRLDNARSTYQETKVD